MRKGFTLLELVFVIVIFGILSKFGADLLYKIYENYVYSNTFNRLENQSESAVKLIANRLQYRIKDSTISRTNVGSNIIIPIADATSATRNVLEWISMDVDGWRGSTAGSTLPEWSGFIDLTASTPTALVSQGTSTSADDMAIFFIGSNVDLNSSAFGWDGTDIGTQVGVAMHPITITTANILTTTDGNFTNVDVYEYYQLAKTAYAVSLEGRNLFLYHDYQPWSGDQISVPSERTQSLISDDVTSFKFTPMGDIMIIQVCVGDNNVTGVGEYSICKEKVVF